MPRLFPLLLVAALVLAATATRPPRRHANEALADGQARLVIPNVAADSAGEAPAAQPGASPTVPGKFRAGITVHWEYEAEGFGTLTISGNTPVESIPPDGRWVPLTLEGVSLLNKNSNGCSVNTEEIAGQVITVFLKRLPDDDGDPRVRIEFSPGAERWLVKVNCPLGTLAIPLSFMMLFGTPFEPAYGDGTGGYTFIPPPLPGAGCRDRIGEYSAGAVGDLGRSTMTVFVSTC